MKKKSTLEINKKYKEKQKIEKTALDLERKLNKRLESERAKYLCLTEQSKAKIQKQYDKKLEKRLKKIQSEYERRRIDKKHKILGKPVKKKVESLGKKKKKALAEIQKYAKLSKCFIGIDGVIKIPMADKMGAWTNLLKENGKMRGEIQGGHVYGQKNFPHMAFMIDNIRPINGMTNRLQGDQIAERRENLPQDIQKKLWNFSKNLEAKNKLRDHNFYQEIIDKYKALNEIEEKRLGLTDKKKL